MSLYGLGKNYEKIIAADNDIVISSAVLTVSEGKRLIAKAVANMPAVRNAMNKGMVIICKGTTNTLVAEELIGKPIERGSYVLGRVYPAAGDKKLTDCNQLNEIILINGKIAEDIKLDEAVQMLSPGDVVIKGANLLDYQNKLAGVCIAAPNSGTAGTIIPYVIARRAKLIIPIGLEKLISGSLPDIAARLNAPTPRLNNEPAMFTISGDIITEIEAIKQFADVKVYETACGGICGQEGGRWLAIEGAKSQVLKVAAIIKQLAGEQSFVK